MTAWNIIKGFTRIMIRIVAEIIHRLIINIFDTLFGFLNWPEKRLRVKIFILTDSHNNPILSQADLVASIDYAKKIFKRNFNVKLLAHHNSFAEVLQKSAPPEALHVKGSAGALAEEFTITGSFFACNLSGVFYPVTAFVVIDIKGASGCSLGPISDYVTLNTHGARDPSTLAHEIAHSCGLWHLDDKSNLMWRSGTRGEEVKWWQKNLFRSSRHVTYW